MPFYTKNSFASHIQHSELYMIENFDAISNSYILDFNKYLVNIFDFL